MYVIYLYFLRNNVKNKAVLEIGPGRGAWSKVIMEEGAKKLYALDALSATHNNFFEHVDPDGKHQGKIQYIQVSDFSCSLPEDTEIDFFFSFGCFCHIRRQGTAEYFRNIYKFMKPQAEGFVMISDYSKMYRAFGLPFDEDNFIEGDSGTGVPWSHLGTDWFCNMITDLGFHVLNKDIECNARDPIVHFVR